MLSSSLSRAIRFPCGPSLRRSAAGAPLRRHHQHSYAAGLRSFSMSPSIEDRSVRSSGKPAVLLMDEIKLADGLLRDLSEKWEVIVSPPARSCPALTTWGLPWLSNCRDVGELRVERSTVSVDMLADSRGKV